MNTAATRNNIAALNQYAVNLLDKIVARAGALMAHYRGRIAAREEDGA